MQKEYCKNNKSENGKKLRTQYKLAKKKAAKEFNKEFVTDLKVAKPLIFHKMAERLGELTVKVRVK